MILVSVDDNYKVSSSFVLLTTGIIFDKSCYCCCCCSPFISQFTTTTPFLLLFSPSSTFSLLLLLSMYTLRGRENIWFGTLPPIVVVVVGLVMAIALMSVEEVDNCL